MEDQYPSNSKVVKRHNATGAEAAAPAPRPKVQPVVTGSVRRKEKGILRKAKEAFVGDDSKGVGEYVVVDILIPGIKRMFEESITQGLSRKLWGAGAPVGGSPFLRPQNWVNYAQPSTLRQQPPLPPTGALSQQARTQHRFDEIIFAARVDAEGVLNQLHNLIAEYQMASVRDFYDSVGETPAYTDENYGWRDLTGAHIRPARGGGYFIVLPRPEPLN